MSIISSISSCFGKKSVESPMQSTALSDREKKLEIAKFKIEEFDSRLSSICHRICGLACSTMGACFMLNNLSSTPNLLGAAIGAGFVVVGIDLLRVGQAMSKYARTMHDELQSFQDMCQKTIYIFKGSFWEAEKGLPYFYKDSWVMGPVIQFTTDLIYDMKKIDEDMKKVT